MAMIVELFAGWFVPALAGAGLLAGVLAFRLTLHIDPR